MDVKLKIVRALSPDTVELGVRSRSVQIDRIISFIKGQEVPQIVGTKDDRDHYIPLDTCISFSSSQKKVYVTTMNQENFKVNSRLYELVDKLPKSFVRISNTEIINLNFVSEFELSKTGIIVIYFKNGMQTSSSRRYLRKVKERLL